MPAKSTIDDFIRKAREIHGGKYSYDKFTYVNNVTKGVITCPVHGDFLQRPNGHTQGSGCPQCSKKARWNTKRFIKESTKIHNSFYDYSLSEYKGTKTKLKIICPIHGVFEQRPDAHIEGKGCWKCSVETRSRSNTLGTDRFIKRAMNVHGELYDYTSTEYVGSDKRVTVTCEIHGEFSIIPKHHLMGQGCPKCAKSTFSQELDQFVYIAVSTCGKYQKIGITNDPVNRLESLRKQTPFPVNMRIIYQCKDARLIENSVKSSFDNSGLYGFIGHTEWFDSKLDIEQHIRSML